MYEDSLKNTGSHPDIHCQSNITPKFFSARDELLHKCRVFEFKKMISGN